MCHVKALKPNASELGSFNRYTNGEAKSKEINNETQKQKAFFCRKITSEKNERTNPQCINCLQKLYNALKFPFTVKPRAALTDVAAISATAAAAAAITIKSIVSINSLAAFFDTDKCHTWTDALNGKECVFECV